MTEPEVTEPEVTEPEETEPEVTEPEETEPEVTEPEVTEPEETEPEVTGPEIVEDIIIIEDTLVPLTPVQPTESSVKIIHKLILTNEEIVEEEVIENLTVGTFINLADYTVDDEGVVCITDLNEVEITEEQGEFVLEYTLE